MICEINSKVDSLLENDQNKFKIKCSRCSSIILNQLTATYLDETNELPSMHSKAEEQSLSNNDDSGFLCEKLRGFWVVSNMYAFENVGFSHIKDNKKYLLCADCEIGPIGFQDLDKPNNFLVAIDRVDHI